MLVKGFLFVILISCIYQIQSYLFHGSGFRHFSVNRFRSRKQVDASTDASLDDIETFGKRWGTETSSQIINREVVFGKEIENLPAQIICKPYPFIHLGLPFLKDSVKYFSGKIGRLFWHQDMDHVRIFYPVDDNISKSDVNIELKYQHIKIQIQNEVILSFQSYDRFTEGSFWHFEYDKMDQKYLFIELEKRLRYINWNGLFGGVPEEEASLSDTPEAKMKVLEKLFQANKGLSKLSGENTRPATMEEMMDDSNLLSHVHDKVDTTAYPMSDEEVKEENLNQQLYRQMLYEKEREEAKANGRPIPELKEESGEEIDDVGIETEEPTFLKERTDDDLGDFDEEEL